MYQHFRGESENFGGLTALKLTLPTYFTSLYPAADLLVKSKNAKLNPEELNEVLLNLIAYTNVISNT